MDGIVEIKGIIKKKHLLHSKRFLRCLILKRRLAYQLIKKGVCVMKRTLIQNADWVLTMNDERTRLRNADVLIEGKKILAVGQNLTPDRPADEVIDAKGCIVLPGFVNTHHHTFQSLVRNIHVANGLKLEPWLWVVYQVFEDINPEVARAGTMIGLGELLKTGCTTSQDHFYAHPKGQKELIDAQILAAEELGIRFHPTRGSLSVGKSSGSPHVPDTLVETTEELMLDSERLIQKWHDNSEFSMCRVGIAPCWPEFETREVMVASRDLARKHGVQLHSHLAESVGEREFCLEKYGCTPVQFVQELGWLGEDVYFAHCVQLDDNDVKIMAETKTGISHCPNSNMFLNSGVCRVPDVLEHGGRVSLGVDGAASNNASNMMTEIRNSYVANQLKWGKRGPTADDILYIATRGGAAVLGRNDIGCLAPGMAADIVVMNWNQFQFAGGKNDPASTIVLSADSKIVDKVFVNGRMVVDGGTLTTIDEEAVMNESNRVGKSLLERSCARVPELRRDL